MRSKNTIDAHGPIDYEFVGSAAKRIAGSDQGADQTRTRCADAKPTEEGVPLGWVIALSPTPWLLGQPG